MSAEARLKDLGLVLPDPPVPVGRYIQAVQHDDVLYVAGHGPARTADPVIGKIGAELSLEQGITAARLTAVNTLAIIRDHLGSLDRVVRFLKVVARVHAVPNFIGHARVVDGYTDLMISIFDEAALCARSAPGMGSAPFGVAIIADAILQVR